jgi:hypothetical protein
MILALEEPLFERMIWFYAEMCTLKTVHHKLINYYQQRQDTKELIKLGRFLQW